MRTSSLRGVRTVGFVLVSALSLGWAPEVAADAPIVIVLSWDGVRHDYLDRAEFPALKRIEEQGVRAERLNPIFPSSTFPNHVALATGTHADRHGIVNNVFRDSKRGVYSYSKEADWLDAEPIWATAERQGVRAATFFWVGSETDWRGTGATLRKTPFDSDVGEAAKVDQILAWLDLPGAQRPGLIMAWWHGADGVGHVKGPNHPAIAEQLAEQDSHLARLLAGIDDRDIWGHTTLIIVSDHGMTEVDQVIEVREPLEKAGIDADVIPAAATATVFLKDPARKPEALRVLRQIAEVAVYAAEDLPDDLRIRHPTRNGDLMLITTPPRTFFQAGMLRSAGIYAAGLLLDWKPGMHGYATDHPDMGAILLAMGRGVPKGVRIGPVDNIQVAPTIAKLLGIAPPAQAEGSAIPEITAQGTLSGATE
jgi:predicted AlkP superfamily pyrophosphatase or phosphodiesterase